MKNNRSKFNLAVIIPELCKYGGAERYLIECLMRWQDLHWITVYATKFNEELLAESGLTKIKTKRLTPRFEGEHATLLNAVLLPKIWETEIGRHDVYHTHLWPTHLLNLHPMVWFPHEPLRMLYDLRYAQIEDDSIGKLQKKLHFYPKQTYDNIDGNEYEATLAAIEAFDKTGHPDRVVGNSKYTAEYLHSVYGYEVKDFVYPGVTVDDVPLLPGTNDIVLTIGQLWPHKRMRIIIEAVSQLEGVQLYIVGSGPEKAHLERIAERLGVADRVFFLHGLDNQEVKILLARCLCVVFTPAREPFGIVALEALAAGKPLVAVNEGGYTEVVDSDCALLVPPEPAAIAHEVARLQANPDLARRLGEHGREVAARYSWDRTARELLAIIEDTHKKWVCTTSSSWQASGPLYAVHYFTWYQEGFGSAHWCDEPASGWVTDVPQLGYYSSLHGDTLATHLVQLEGLGMDVVILNLHVDGEGLNVYQARVAQRMMKIAKARSSRLRFVINLCPYTRDHDRIRAAFVILRKDIIELENYLHIGSRPAFMVFWSGAFDGDLEIVEQLRGETDGYMRIGVFTRLNKMTTEARKTFGLFDAVSQLSPLELGEPSRWEETWQREYDASAMGSGYHCVTLSPGYDDSHLLDPNRVGGVRTVPRREGKTYRRTMDFALRQESPTLVIVNSFNEFHENTHIEPSQKYGMFYLDMTRVFIQEARKRWKPIQDTANKACDMMGDQPGEGSHAQD